ENIIEEALKPFEKNREDLNIKHHVQDFFKLRATYLLKEKMIEQDIIDSVLQGEIGIIQSMIEKALILSQKRADESFKFTQEALVRVLNLAKQYTKGNVDESLFITSSEKELYHRFLSVRESYLINSSKRQMGKAFEELCKLALPIHEFFEYNMVMSDDEAVKENRLAL